MGEKSKRKLYKEYKREIKTSNINLAKGYAKSQFDRQSVGGEEVSAAINERFGDGNGFKMKSQQQILREYNKALKKSLKQDQGFYRTKGGKSDLAIQGKKTLKFKDWEPGGEKTTTTFDPPPFTTPTTELITPEITPTKFDFTLPQYQIEKSTGEQLIPGTPGHWLNWFKIQRKIPNNIGNTVVYPPTGKEYIIELGGDTVPGTPGEVISTQDYSITKDGQPMDMSGLSEYERKSIYRDVKREYLKTADITDQAKMYFEEFGYDKGWDEFLEYKKK